MNTSTSCPAHEPGISARLLALDGATCPACRESLARVTWRGKLALVSCGAGCSGRRILAAAHLTLEATEAGR